MNHTDFRSLCAEHLKAWDSDKKYAEDHDALAALIEQTRAALAAPQQGAPSDEDLNDMWDAQDSHVPAATNPVQLRPVDRYTLGDAIRTAYLKHGNDSWCSIADEVIAALAAPQQGAPSDEDLKEIYFRFKGRNIFTEGTFCDAVRVALSSYGAQAVPVAVADVRYEFAVYDAETDEPQAGGEAPTLEEAQREGRHYLAMYGEDGPMRLELRRVEVLPLPEAQP